MIESDSVEASCGMGEGAGGSGAVVAGRTTSGGTARRAAAGAVAAAVVVATLLAGAGCGPAPVRLDPGAFRKGISLGLYASDPRFNYEPLIGEIADHGANAISFVVVWMQEDAAAVRVERDPVRTVADRTLRLAIRAAHRRGLEVMILPIVLLRAAEGDDWRGRLRPTDTAAWFASYRARMTELARLAADEGAAWLCVGSELCSLEVQEAEWRRVIADVRDLFPGRLVYSANWDRLESLDVWHDLDAMGMSGYFELTRRLDPSREELAAAWQRWREQIHALRRRRAIDDVPLMFTEIGYHSQDGTARHPWDYTLGRPLDLDEQRLAYEAFFEAWRDDPALAGLYIYTWFGTGGPHDGDYTPRGKPAAAVIRAAFRTWPR